MRPVKRSLKLLENPGDNLTETEHVEQTRQVWIYSLSLHVCLSSLESFFHYLFQCLLKIGDHIMNTTSDYQEPDVASDWRK